MFGGAGAGLATNDAQRVAKARKNYAAKGRRSALLIKEAELESHSLGGALADPTFKSAGHAIQASLRAGAAARDTKKENSERAKLSKNITAGVVASVIKRNENEREKAAKALNGAHQRAANIQAAAVNKAKKEAAAERSNRGRRARNAVAARRAASAAEKRTAVVAGVKAAFGKRAAAVGEALTAKKIKMSDARSAANAKAVANNEAIFARLGNQYYTTLNKNKLMTAKILIRNYNKLHPLQMRSKNNQRIQNLRSKVKNYEAAANKKEANAKAAANAEKKAPNALKNYLVATVKPRYNKALVNAILRLPKLNNNTRRRLQSPRMYALQSGAGAFRSRATTVGGALGRGAGALGNKARGFFSRSAAVPATGGGFFSRLFAPKPPPSFIPFKQGMKIPLGYVLKRNNKNKGLGYYKNNKALESQVEQRGYGPAPKPTGTTTGVSIGVGPSRYRNNYGYGNNYGNRYGNNRRGPGAPSGGIVFAPKINVGAARIGAQTFGGTRVGGQQMGGSRATTGNVGGTRVTTGNAGRLAVSAPTTNGNRQLAATPEQLIRGAGGAEAVEQGIKALNAANGNVTRAKAASRLPNNTFTNIYAMGGPNAAKRLVESRRRRRTVGARGSRVGTGARGAPGKKKRVAHKPKKYIKLTPYQFRRLTDHIKKNNLRKVLIKEITH